MGGDEHENFSPVSCLALHPASRLSRLWSLTCQMCLEQLQVHFPCSPGLEKLLSCCKAACPLYQKRVDVTVLPPGNSTLTRQAFSCLPRRTSSRVELVIACIRGWILNLPVLLYDLGS